VSEVIADLEHTLGVRLFDRNPQGVEPTRYGQALLKRGLAAFDELKQGIRDIEFLADPTAGELTIGHPEFMGRVILPQMIERFSEKYPRVIVRADIVPAPDVNVPGLRDRTLDLVLGRMLSPLPDDHVVDDLNVEVLFDDPLVVVTSRQSHWAHRREVDLAELVDEPWVLPLPNSWSYACVAEAFKAKGLRPPKASLVSNTMGLRTKLLANRNFITVVWKSVLRHGDDRNAMQELPVRMPARPWSVAILTLKNRTLSPVVERFIECAREVAKSMAKRKS
jgi:DNA-binding transcriptional LysR family regulator